MHVVVSKTVGVDMSIEILTREHTIVSCTYSFKVGCSCSILEQPISISIRSCCYPVCEYVHYTFGKLYSLPIFMLAMGAKHC